jgi:four helix bundle protein
MEPKKYNYDLEERLIRFACLCLTICDLLPNNRSGQNLEYQLSKSGTAPALIYGEAQAAESRADFIHKIKLVLKEIKETRINLRIIRQKPVIKHILVEEALGEADQLMAIFIKSVETAKNNK